MNKRQRKKHRLGEFQQLGFELRFGTPQDWTDAEQNAFWDECIARVESLGLAVGGGAGVTWDVFVTALRDRGSVTSEQRASLLAWLAAHPGVSQIEAGSLEDAWYPPLLPNDSAT